ncbi:MAG: tripartite tricarboxylate transporter permease [Pseudomonadota bacterium]
MDVLSLLADGILIALEPANLLICFIGVVIGLFVGAMPGLGSVNGVAILLPIIFFIKSSTGSDAAPMIFLAAIYYGAMYGGAISSIMLGIPGASTAVATTFDGRPLALKGRAEQALVTAALASFIGGTIANIFFTGFAPPLADVALRFGNPEIFALMLLAFATFVGLGGDDIAKTVISIMIGLVCASIGFDVIGGEPRLQFFDLAGFSRPINFLVLAIGVYGVGEMLWTLHTTRGDSEMSKAEVSVANIKNAAGNTVKEGWRGTSIGSALGFFVGILPAAGATPGSLMAYGVSKMTSPKKEEFGKGSIDGVAAPEAANNSASTGAMLPMMTLGIPGSPTTAVLLTGLVLLDLEPGPRLFSDQPEFVWPVIGSFYISNFIAVIVNLAFIPVFLWMLRMPFTILAPIIFVLSTAGVYAATDSMFDVWLMFWFGLGAFMLRILDYPLAPAALAIVLGKITEETLRQSLQWSDGSFGIFFNPFFDRTGQGETFWIAPIIGWIAVVLLLLPLFNLIRRKFAARRAGAEGHWQG